MQQRLKIGLGYLSIITLTGCLVGYLTGIRAVYDNRYFILGWWHLAWRTLADAVIDGSLAGLAVGCLATLSWLVIGIFYHDRRRRMIAVFGSWLLSAAGFILLWQNLPTLLAGDGHLPFFCPDIAAFGVFLHRALWLKLTADPLAGLGIWSAMAGWFLAAHVLALFGARLIPAGDDSSPLSSFKSKWILIALVATAIFIMTPLAGHRFTRPAMNENAPKILLLSVDTLRADRLGCYGGPASTPVIDGLAARGVRAENALAPSPWTLPSHAAMLAGQHPTLLGVRRVTDKIPATVVMTPEFLAANGYATAAFVSHLFVSPVYGFDQGFARFDYIASEKAADVSRHAKEWIARSKKPWFVFCHFFDPHWPYEAENSPPPDANDDLRQRNDYARALRAAQADPALARDVWLPLYDAEIEQVDKAIGQLLAALQEREMLANTVVILVSDHGEAFGEYPHDGGDDRFDPQRAGSFGHGITCQPGTLRVPFIIAGPNLGDLRPNGQVNLIELPALIARLAQLPPQNDFKPFSQTWLGGERTENPFIADTYLGGDARYGVYRDERFLLTAVNVSYLDLHLDLPPVSNLPEGDDGEDLLATLAAFQRQAGVAGADTAHVSSTQLERLKQLGYLGDTP